MTPLCTHVVIVTSRSALFVHGFAVQFFLRFLVNTRAVFNLNLPPFIQSSPGRCPVDERIDLGEVIVFAKRMCFARGGGPARDFVRLPKK